MYTSHIQHTSYSTDDESLSCFLLPVTTHVLDLHALLEAQEALELSADQRGYVREERKP